MVICTLPRSEAQLEHRSWSYGRFRYPRAQLFFPSASWEQRSLFGDHTFFLDGNGLNIVEPADTSQLVVQAGKVVNLASWNDEDPPKLAPHEPEATEVVILLEFETLIQVRRVDAH